MDVGEPTDADVDALRALLDGLRALPQDARLADLDRAIRGTFRSNRGQRRYVLEALGIAGILCPANLPSYLSRWVGFDEREDWLLAVDHVRSCGVEFVAGPYVHAHEGKDAGTAFTGASGSHAFYFLDPDGIEVEHVEYQNAETPKAETPKSGTSKGNAVHA